MSLLISQMLGCLIIAAGIGGAVGWLLKNVSAGTLTQQLSDVTAMMRLKEQMLEKARHELRGTGSDRQAIESQLRTSEALSQANQEELSLRQGRIQTLQEELAAAKQQLVALESGQTKLLTRISHSEAETLAQKEEARRFKAALDASQQALTLKEEALRPLHERLAILENHHADTDRLHTRIKELESAQEQLHRLEVQINDRDTQHRAALHEVELALAGRDRRIGELEQLHQQLKKQAEDDVALKAPYMQTVTQPTDEAA